MDGNGFPVSTVYSYDPATSAWTTQDSLLAATGFLAGTTGPDGLIYAIGGQSDLGEPVATVEAFTTATAQTAPDPYLGNGSYQSPDIILLDSTHTPIPIGGAPGGLPTSGVGVGVAGGTLDGDGGVEGGRGSASARGPAPLARASAVARPITPPRKLKHPLRY